MIRLVLRQKTFLRSLKLIDGIGIHLKQPQDRMHRRTLELYSGERVEHYVFPEGKEWLVVETVVGVPQQVSDPSTGESTIFREQSLIAAWVISGHPEVCRFIVKRRKLYEDRV